MTKLDDRNNPQTQAFQEELEHRLEEIDGGLEKLKSRSEGLAAEGKRQYREALIELERKRDRVKQNLTELREASGARAEELGERVKTAWTELKDGFVKATDALTK